MSFGPESVCGKNVSGFFEWTSFVEEKYKDKSGLSGDELLEFVRNERRRELCFEEAMRFWDLRRQGMPELKHKWYSSWDKYETYTLPQGSKNYVLSIPRSELDYNNGCYDNERNLIKPE